MNTAELRQKSAAELHGELTALLREHFNLRMQKGLGQLTQPARLRTIRREVARIKTILREQARPAA